MINKKKANRKSRKWTEVNKKRGWEGGEEGGKRDGLVLLG